MKDDGGHPEEALAVGGAILLAAGILYYQRCMTIVLLL